MYCRKSWTDFNCLVACFLLLSTASACSRTGPVEEYCACEGKTNVVGINLSPDYLTAALALEPDRCEGGQQQYDMADPEYLVRYEGNDAYKSFMRRRWAQKPIITRQDRQTAPLSYPSDAADSDNSQLFNSTIGHLPSTFLEFGSTLDEYLRRNATTDRESLLSPLSSFKTALDESLNRNVSEEYVLITYPTHLPDNIVTNYVRPHLEAAGFHNLVLQPSLSLATLPPYDQPSSPSAVLILNLHNAYLEMALLEIDKGLVEIVDYKTIPGLGEDQVALTLLAETTNNNTSDPVNPLNFTALSAFRSHLHTLQQASLLHQSPTTNTINTTLSSHLTTQRSKRAHLIETALTDFLTQTLSTLSHSSKSTNPSSFPHSAIDLTPLSLSSPGDATPSDFFSLPTIVLSTLSNLTTLSGLNFRPNLPLRVLIDGDAHPWNRAAATAAMAGMAGRRWGGVVT